MNKWDASDRCYGAALQFARGPSVLQVEKYYQERTDKYLAMMENFMKVFFENICLKDDVECPNANITGSENLA